MLVRVVLIVNEAALRRRLARLFASLDVAFTEARPRGDFWQRLGQETCDLIVVDRRLIPIPIAETVSHLRILPEQPEVVVLTEREEPEERAHFLASGCLAVINVGIRDQSFGEVIGALVARRQQAQVTRLGAAAPAFRLGDFSSRSRAMQKFLRVATKVAASDTAVLILGETGVGKEWLARALHQEGPRASGPFVVVNCGAVPEALWESELFGHEEGSFTGAVRAHRGYCELAHRGTLFLDEIGEMPLHLQVKLLRVLQEHQVRRVGSERPLAIDLRVIAATNRDLGREMQEQRFRPDLYYRLSVVTLTIPPLRDRPEDIEDFAKSYVAKFAARMSKPVAAISPPAMQALVAYSWPGNIRELVNVMERAVLLCAGDIALEDLPETISGSGARVDPLPPDPVRSAGIADSLDPRWLDHSLADARHLWVDAFERAYLEELLRQTHGRIAETAERAGIDPRSLYTKMRHHGLRKEDYRGRPPAEERAGA